jgi:hypothetical protein
MENRWFKPSLLSGVLDYEGFTGEKIAEKILKTYNGGLSHAAGR